MTTSFFLLLVACSVFVIVLACDAPEGWQDENGFHLGKPPRR